jgi:hypothetical protein
MIWFGCLVGVIVVTAWPLGFAYVHAQRAPVPRGVVRYSTAMKVAATVLTLSLAVVLGVASQWRLERGDLPPIGFMGFLLLAVGLPMVVESFFVHHTYDEEGVHYRSPWTPERRLLWAEVAGVRWNRNRKWLVLEDTHGARFRISPKASGLQAFAETARRRILPEVLQASPAGAAALDLMQRGLAILLQGAKRGPEWVRNKLPPKT